ncbi:hypothetical protein R3W88_029161 [Solanum pinnatisectum]|uniref:Uncharacterized protein n=1 Tax=Solanum pinnatisectum TaxID=50273 RepID=A0AAV9K4I2_9SOLN|nr:hypothetical protein R3W88_029161 [Solanum pinnatisectum]
MFLDKAKKETKLHRNTAERLKLEAEESLLAWNGKETSLIACTNEAEEMGRATKLNESLKSAGQTTKAAREENCRLRDILKQAINEANAFVYRQLDTA